MEFQEIVSEINDAFYRLESFSHGRISDYHYFGFNVMFTKLFVEAKKQKNYTYKNNKLIGKYWDLTEQIRYDYDKGNFENYQAYENEMFCKDCEEIMYLNWDRIEEFCDFSSLDEREGFERKFSISDILKAQQSEKPKPKLNKALILFSRPEIIENIHNELKGYFEGSEKELLKALKGELLKELLLFPHNQNKFVEVFKRLKYNKLLLSTPTETRDWICSTFLYQYKKGNKKEVRKFNISTVYDILTKDKGEPSKRERICDNLDWLPYKSYLTRQREAQKEKI